MRYYWRPTKLRDRQAIPEGEFGSLGDYYCENCRIYIYGNGGCPNWPHELQDVDTNPPYKLKQRYHLKPYMGHCQHGTDWREECAQCIQETQCR